MHNETSTGCTSRIDEVRRAIDAAGHPALLMVDTISSLASIDYRHDEWGVDVTVAGSQKGLMLPPGLSFNAISDKALEAAETARAAAQLLGLAADAGGQQDRLLPLHAGHQPAVRPERGDDDAAWRRGWPTCSPATTATPRRRAARCAPGASRCSAPSRAHYSSSLTAVRVPEGHSADALRAVILEKFNMSLGNGLGILKDRVFRIGHLGDFGDLQLIGTLGGVEMGLRAAGVPHQAGGVAGGDRLPRRECVGIQVNRMINVPWERICHGTNSANHEGGPVRRDIVATAVRDHQAAERR